MNSNTKISTFFIAIIFLVATACNKTPKTPRTQTVSVYFEDDPAKIKSSYQVFEKDTTVKHGRYTSYHKNGNTKMVVNYVKGKKEGIGQIYSEEGRLRETAEFKSDQLNGLRKLYNDSTRQLIIVESYVNNNFEGEYLSYHPNENVKQKGQYANNKMSGLWSFYYPSGKLKEEVHYKNNTENGPYKAYHENGQLKVEGQYENENRQGLWKVYHPNGVLEEEANYVDDLEEGFIEVFDSTGKKIKAISYKKGRVQNLERF